MTDSIDIQEAKALIAKTLSYLPEEDAQIGFLNGLKQWLHQLSPLAAMPVDHVQWVPLAKIEANDYNPNSVAPNEMRLLHTSISHDGYTQPVVAIHDKERDVYVIVDGFHRFTTCRTNADIQAMTKGHVPMVVIDKPINDRMASTIRHNRARGKHSVDGMGEMIFNMLEGGWKDLDICNEIGVTPEELIRLKHVTGFSKQFENAEYKKAWQTARMARYKRDYEKGLLSDDGDTEAEEASDAEDCPTES